MKFMTAAIGLVATGLAQAVPVTSDAFNVQLPGTNLAASPHLAGDIVARSSTPFSMDISSRCPDSPTGACTDPTSGVLDAWVVRAADQTYDFYWQVSHDANGWAYFDALRIDGFGVAGQRLDTNWRSDLPGTRYPALWAASTAGGTNQLEYGFSDEFVVDADNRLLPGTQSSVFFVDTDARAYGTGATLTVQSLVLGGYLGGESAQLVTFTPAVPEPETYALMLGGLAMVGAAARRQRRRQA